ncbi:MAG: MarR family transcriptional regulator [Planctomycetes bacterium]|nr:MarR family transcriptional regulator [Planctomycetota bacterium]
MERAERMGATEEVRGGLVELWGRLAPFWGISPGAARVFAYLLTRAAPVDADELVEGLALSRGAVSMAVRELEEWGLVRRSKLAGERRELYAPESELERAVKSIVRTRKRREWDPLLERLREWVPELERERSADAVALRARLEQIEALVALADGMAASFLEGGIVKQLGLKALVLAAERAGKRAAKKRR